MILLRGADVVFEVSADLDCGGWGAEGDEAAGVFGGLGEPEGGAAKDAGPDPAEAEGAPEAAVGDAGVDDDDRDVGVAALVHHAGPDFAFHEDEGGGAEDAEEGAGGESEVERHEEDAVWAEALPGEVVRWRWWWR